jgi:hypothetical protein
VPLSEHEQQLLDQIERALYAEDPKFASTVRGARFRRRGTARRRRLQGGALFVIGLGLLIGGMLVPVKLFSIPILSVIGFLLMFAGAVLVWTTLRGTPESDSAPKNKGQSASGGKHSFTKRMEDRLRRRFEDGQ